jgi:hypothetical protein
MALMKEKAEPRRNKEHTVVCLRRLYSERKIPFANRMGNICVIF